MASVFSRLNPTPAFPQYPGPYQVGTVDYEIDSSELQNSSSSDEEPLVPTVAFRCFYPCETSPKPSRPVYWLQSPQRSTLSAYVRFGGVNPAFANVLAYFPRLLYHITLPVHRDAQILKSPHRNGRWPVVVFSHGLGGSRNSYSQICGSLASYGLFVVATEHRDGSCPISYVGATNHSQAYSVDYDRYPHTPSEEVFQGRDKQLRIRLWEMNNIYEALLRIDSDVGARNLKQSKSDKKDLAETAAMFRSKLDLHNPGRVTWAGHSFGATTVTQLIKSVFYARQGIQTSIYPNAPSTSLETQISPQSPTMLLDLWALPLQSPATESLKKQPLPCFAPSNRFGGASVLAVLSEHFAKWSGNFNDVKELLSDPYFDLSQQDLSTESRGHHERPGANIFFPEKSAHLSQSDFGILFPRLTKYFAQAEEPERTIKLNVRAMLQVVRNAGIEIAETSPTDMETDESDEAKAIGNDSTDTNALSKGDWKILNHQNGLIRGWISLDTNHGTAPLKLSSPNSKKMRDDHDSLQSHESTSTGNLSDIEPAMGEDQFRIEAR